MFYEHPITVCVPPAEGGGDAHLHTHTQSCCFLNSRRIRQREHHLSSEIGWICFALSVAHSSLDAADPFGVVKGMSANIGGIRVRQCSFFFIRVVFRVQTSLFDRSHGSAAAGLHHLRWRHRSRDGARCRRAASELPFWSSAIFPARRCHHQH
jgi:hypothetical protein